MLFCESIMGSGDGEGVLRSVGDPGYVKPMGLLSLDSLAVGNCRRTCSLRTVCFCMAAFVSLMPVFDNVSSRPRASIFRFSANSASSTSSMPLFLPFGNVAKVSRFSLSPKAGARVGIACFRGFNAGAISDDSKRFVCDDGVFTDFGTRSPSTRREGVLEGLCWVVMFGLRGVVALMSLLRDPKTRVEVGSNGAASEGEGGSLRQRIRDLRMSLSRVTRENQQAEIGSVQKCCGLSRVCGWGSRMWPGCDAIGQVGSVRLVHLCPTAT